MPKNSASARPRSRSSNVCTTIASAAGNMIAPPAPWITRKVTIHASARLPLGVSPHIAEAPANTITPSVTIRRWPDGVGQPAAEGEQRRQRQQVGVDRPLHAGAGEAELLLDLRRRDRHDRLVDEGHRDGEDHRRQDQVPRLPAGRGNGRHLRAPSTVVGAVWLTTEITPNPQPSRPCPWPYAPPNARPSSPAPRCRTARGASCRRTSRRLGRGA